MGKVISLLLVVALLFIVVPVAMGQNPTLQATPREVEPGGVVDVTIYGLTYTGQDVLVLYGDRGRVSSWNIPRGAVRITVAMPQTEGDYFFAIAQQDALLGPSNLVRVKHEETASVTVSPAVAHQAQAITVTWSSPSFPVYLYPYSLTQGYLNRVTLPAARGSMQLQAPQAGKYQYILYNGVEVVASSGVLEVVSLTQPIANIWRKGSQVSLCPGTQLRAGDGEEFGIERIVSAQTQAVVINGRRYGSSRLYLWWDVRLPDGKTGWVRQDQADCTVLPPGAMHGKYTYQGWDEPRSGWGLYVQVLIRNLMFRTGPGLEYSAPGHMARADYYPVLAEQNGWIKVRTANGLEGWVSSQYVNFSAPVG